LSAQTDASARLTLAEHRLQLARELIDDLELSRLQPEQLLLKISRLARLTDDAETQAWVELELKGYNESANAPPAVWEKYRALTGRLTDPSKDFGYWQPFAGLMAWIRSMEVELQSLTIPDVHFAPTSANPNEWVVGFVGQHVKSATAPAETALSRRAHLTSQISQLRGVVSRIVGLLHDFVAQTFYELEFRNAAEGIFDSHRKEVDALLAKTAGAILAKIPAIVARLSSGDPEELSQAMTTARRVLVAFADAVQPPGEPLKVNGELWEADAGHHLNRLRFYILQRCQSDRRRKRLTQTVVSLNERFSAGTHADVTPDEAKALFVLLYITLGELASLPAEQAG
jgi:AbiTii-like protein